MITRIDNAKSVTQADSRCACRGEAFPRRREAQRRGACKRAHQQQAQVVRGARRRSATIQTQDRGAAAAAPRRSRARSRGSTASRLPRQALLGHSARAAARIACIGAAAGGVDRWSALGDHSGVRLGRRPAPTHGGVVQSRCRSSNSPTSAARRTGRLRLLGSRGLCVRGSRRLASALLVRAVGYGVPVSREQLQPGDLVFFDGLGHVGLYIGGGQFVHAPHTGDVVKISSLARRGTPRPSSAPAGSSRPPVHIVCALRLRSSR